MTEKTKKILLSILLALVLVVGCGLTIYFQFDNIKGLFNKEEIKEEIKEESKEDSSKKYQTVQITLVTNESSEVFDSSDNIVKVILHNDKNTYQYTFQGKDQITAPKTMVVEDGEYNYTILSTILRFDKYSGTLTVDKDSNQFEFAYMINTYQSFNLFLNDIDHSGSKFDNTIQLYTYNITNLLNMLNSFILNLNFYDDFGNLAETIEDTVTKPGNYLNKWMPHNLTPFSTYTAQLSISPQDDQSTEYFSTAVIFTWSNIGHEFNFYVITN